MVTDLVCSSEREGRANGGVVRVEDDHLICGRSDFSGYRLSSSFSFPTLSRLKVSLLTPRKRREAELTSQSFSHSIRKNAHVHG